MSRVRQLLTLRFVAALAALVLLAVGVDAVFASGNQQGSLAVTGPSNRDANGDVIERRIDLISGIEQLDVSDDFAVGPDGTTVGTLDAVLDPDGRRVMRVAPGTPGEISCTTLEEPGTCAVIADVLGQAVVWFAVFPEADRDTVQLPPIVDLQEGYALFENGWQIKYPPAIDRDDDEGGTCAGQDITNFSDFLRRFGPNSTTIVDLETQQVVQVQCGPEYIAPDEIEKYDGDLKGSVVTAPVSTELAIDPDIEAPES